MKIKSKIFAGKDLGLSTYSKEWVWLVYSIDSESRKIISVGVADSEEEAQKECDKLNAKN